MTMSGQVCFKSASTAATAEIAACSFFYTIKKIFVKYKKTAIQCDVRAARTKERRAERGAMV